METKDKKTTPAFVQDVTDELRGKSKPSGNPVSDIFMIFLLGFSAMNTFNLFAKSFGMLGIGIAIGAIGVFDGAYFFWDHQRRKHAKGKAQERIAKLAQTLCIIGASVMIAMDFSLHSGQDFLPLGLEIVAFGMSALLSQVFGSIAMILAVSAFGVHMWLSQLFKNNDIEQQQAVLEREAIYEAKRQQLLTQKAQNAVMAEYTAAAVEALAQRSEAQKTLFAERMSDMIQPVLLAKWAKNLTGGDVIEAEYKDATPTTERAYAADTMQPADTSANPTTPAPRRAKK